MKLGKIKRITDLRTVWPHEANSFTKWLAQEAHVAKVAHTATKHTIIRFIAIEMLF